MYMFKNNFSRKNQIIYTLNTEKEKLLQKKMDKILLLADGKWSSRREAMVECLEWFVEKYEPVYLLDQENQDKK